MFIQNERPIVNLYCMLPYSYANMMSTQTTDYLTNSGTFETASQIQLTELSRSKLIEVTKSAFHNSPSLEFYSMDTHIECEIENCILEASLVVSERVLETLSQELQLKINFCHKNVDIFQVFLVKYVLCIEPN